jgi:hypothetical protein
MWTWRQRCPRRGLLLSVENCVVLRRVGYKQAFGPAGRDSAAAAWEKPLMNSNAYSVVYRRIASNSIFLEVMQTTPSPFRCSFP